VRFKTDENLPVEAALALRDYGFDVETVWGEALAGADDQTVVARAHGERRILITLDLDFANIHAYPPGQHSGIVVLRLKHQDKTSVVRQVHRLVAALNQRSPVGELWVVETNRIRFREAT
jgi:predicted nuclease of predicted toxin-antitoxin system